MTCNKFYPNQIVLDGMARREARKEVLSALEQMGACERTCPGTAAVP